MSQRLPTSMRSSPSPPQRQGAAGGTRGPVLFAAPLVLPLPLTNTATTQHADNISCLLGALYLNRNHFGTSRGGLAEGFGVIITFYSFDTVTLNQFIVTLNLKIKVKNVQPLGNRNAVNILFGVCLEFENMQLGS